MTETNDEESSALARRLAELAVGEVLELRGVIDKRTWGPGPWQDEPDLIAWRHSEDAGYLCQINRNEIQGTLNGYVAVPAGHPWHGRDYAEVDDQLSSHGGLTFCGEAVGGRWVFGFDCGHGGDFMPAMEALWRRRDPGMPSWMQRALTDDCGGLFGPGNYRHLAYVRAIVDFMAQQLILIGRGEVIGVCKLCGCTDDDCRDCIEATGEPCRWVTPVLCSRCELQLTGAMP